MREVLGVLIGLEAANRQQRVLQRRLAQARLPKQKTLEEYDLGVTTDFPGRSVATGV
jgi:DNA replication protein DnaC